MMEIDFIEKKKKLYTWFPLWKSHMPRNLSMAERESIGRIRKMLNVSEDFIETVLTIDGEKALRAKTFKGLENGFKTYDYHLFAPLVWENEQLCYRSKVKTESTHPDVVNSYKTVLVSERELINQLHDIFKKRMHNGEALDYMRR